MNVQKNLYIQPFMGHSNFLSLGMRRFYWLFYLKSISRDLSLIDNRSYAPIAYIKAIKNADKYISTYNLLLYIRRLGFNLNKNVNDLVDFWEFLFFRNWNSAYISR